jgi:hypothetical protein
MWIKSIIYGLSLFLFAKNIISNSTDRFAYVDNYIRVYQFIEIGDLISYKLISTITNNLVWGLLVKSLSSLLEDINIVYDIASVTSATLLIRFLLLNRVREIYLVILACPQFLSLIYENLRLGLSIGISLLTISMINSKFKYLLVFINTGIHFTSPFTFLIYENLNKINNIVFKNFNKIIIAIILFLYIYTESNLSIFSYFSLIHPKLIEKVKYEHLVTSNIYWLPYLFIYFILLSKRTQKCYATTAQFGIIFCFLLNFFGLSGVRVMQIFFPILILAINELRLIYGLFCLLILITSGMYIIIINYQ